MFKDKVWVCFKIYTITYLQDASLKKKKLNTPLEELTHMMQNCFLTWLLFCTRLLAEKNMADLSSYRFYN